MSTIVGAQLENYRILEKLGEGGMGAVYRAVDVMLERDVALKFLRPELAREPDLVERFRTEAVVLARLNHQFIASVYGLHRHNADWFIAMEFVPGETLEHRLKGSPRVPADVALHLTSMMLQALEYAHRLGVVHRDIKPANVILRPDGTLKMMDFGIARVLGSERRTRAGTIVGTLGYMAPEQIQGLDIDQRVDLYSTGIVLYEMLTGRLPFDARTDWAMMQAQINEPPHAPREFVASVPEPVERVVLTALEKGPERRFQTASDFQHALEGAARDSGFVSMRLTDWGGARSAGLATRLTPAPGVTSWEETHIGGATPAPGVAPPSAASQPSQPAAQSPAASAKTPVSPVAPPPPAFDVQAPTAGPVVGGPPTGSPAVPVTPMPVSHAPEGTAPAVHKAPARGSAPPGRRTAVLLAALGLLLAVGAVAGWLIWQAQVGTPETGQQVPVTPPTRIAAPPASPTPAEQAAAESAAGQAAEQAAAAAGASPPSGSPGSSPPAAETASAGTPGATAPAERRRRAPRNEPAATPPPIPTGEVAAVEPTPSTPAVEARPEAPVAPPPPVPTAIFRSARLVRPNGPELEVQLYFEPEALFVRNVGGRQSLSGMRYDNIASVLYQQTRPLRVFVRTTRHWLTLHGKGGEQLRLRLEGETVNAIIATIEQRAGVKVKVAQVEEDREQQKRE